MRIRLIDIHKYYGAVHANRGVSLEVASGSIHGILGENGAGKSTLMKILSGLVARSRGEILLDGEAVEYESPQGAVGRGIGMLYQEPLDFPPMTVLENFMLGQCREWRPNPRAYRRKLASMAESFGFQLNPSAFVEQLTVGERQQLEILRLLALEVKVLILDEPTTGISHTQKEILFNALRKLAAQGRSVLLVSHKLEDAKALCDRVTVLRNGKVAGEARHPLDTGSLLRLMFGSAPAPPPTRRKEAGSDAPVLSLENVEAEGGRAGLRECNVSVRRGEVVGLAGLEGSGQGVFLRLAAGLHSSLRGIVRLGDRDMTGRSHLAFKKKGTVFLPASRLEEGLVGSLTLTEHFALAFHGNTFRLPWKKAGETARNRIARFRIKGFPQSSAASMSGGNQQRLLLSLIPPKPSLLLLEQPTRGLDMESAHWIWGYLHKHFSKRAAIVFSSAELDEIFSVADRVLVFFDGRIVLDAPVGEVALEEVARCIAGKGPAGDE